jgi:hypothetical protein
LILKSGWRDLSLTPYNRPDFADYIKIKFIEEDGGAIRGLTVSLLLGFRSTLDVDGRYGYPGQIVRQPYAYLYAENQNKGVFGWEKKRTEALKITGNVSYHIGQYSELDRPIYRYATDLVTTLTQNIFYTTTWTPDPLIPFTFTGTATFFGRGDSQCSL